MPNPFDDLMYIDPEFDAQDLPLFLNDEHTDEHIETASITEGNYPELITEFDDWLYA